MIRQLISDGKLRYLYADKTPDGKLETTFAEKDGPVTFMVTTTRDKLFAENETRVLSLELDDSQAATKAAMTIIAITRGLNMTPGNPVDFELWRDFQRWLAAGELRVIVDFAPELSDLIPPVAVRVRRDWGQVLGAIKAHALLHRNARGRVDDQIVATIEQDYSAIRPLVASILAEAAETKVDKKVQATVTAIKKVLAAKTDHEATATVLEVAHVLKLDRSTARRRLKRAVEQGLIINLETRRFVDGRYKLAAVPGQVDTEMLPTVEKLREAFDAANGSVREEEHIT